MLSQCSYSVHSFGGEGCGMRRRRSANGKERDGWEGGNWDRQAYLQSFCTKGRHKLACRVLSHLDDEIDLEG